MHLTLSTPTGIHSRLDRKSSLEQGYFAKRASINRSNEHNHRLVIKRPFLAAPIALMLYFFLIELKVKK
jgi:hypothetical protein